MHSKKIIRALCVACFVNLASLCAATFDLTSASVADIQAAFNAGALTSEKLTQLFLARIAAYEKQGPALHAIITLNPKALDEPKPRDGEPKAAKVRGPLHGLRLLLKATT